MSNFAAKNLRPILLVAATLLCALQAPEAAARASGRMGMIQADIIRRYPQLLAYVKKNKQLEVTMVGSNRESSKYIAGLTDEGYLTIRSEEIELFAGGQKRLKITTLTDRHLTGDLDQMTVQQEGEPPWTIERTGQRGFEDPWIRALERIYLLSRCCDK